jgi:hypothetical protein
MNPYLGDYMLDEPEEHTDSATDFVEPEIDDTSDNDPLTWYEELTA